MNAQQKIEAPPNVYERLNDAREQFHASEIKKSGKFPKGRGGYFELGDFIVPALKIFHKCGLAGVVSFVGDEARLDVVNTANPEEVIRFCSPMGSANLSGCHEVQNIGAVQTYQRRYLWMMALEIVEHDAIDSSLGEALERKIPDDQWAYLVQLKEASKANVPAMLKHLKINLPGDDLSLLSPSQYDKVCEAMNSKLAKMAKAETDAQAKETEDA